VLAVLLHLELEPQEHLVVLAVVELVFFQKAAAVFTMYTTWSLPVGDMIG
jgi:hypothetical protein